MVSSAPAATPYWIPSPPQRITSAVSVQITIVSAKYFKRYQNIPLFLQAHFVSAHACAIDPVPIPASFEKIPLETPRLIVIKHASNHTAVNADGLKCSYKRSSQNTCGTLSAFSATTPDCKDDIEYCHEWNQLLCYGTDTFLLRQVKQPLPVLQSQFRSPDSPYLPVRHRSHCSL